jgi:L-lactate dehydrogenase
MGRRVYEVTITCHAAEPPGSIGTLARQLLAQPPLACHDWAMSETETPDRARAGVIDGEAATAGDSRAGVAGDETAGTGVRGAPALAKGTGRRRRPVGEPSMAPEPGCRSGGPTKVAIVGTGMVGSTFAYTLLLSGIASEIVLIDANAERAEGEAMDLNHAVPFAHPTKICAGDYSDCQGAAITVIAAGAGQKPGETRLDLVRRNAAIFGQIVPRIAGANPEGIIVVATNPVDVLTYVTLKLAGLPANRVFGSGTILDTARFRYMLSEHLGVDPRSVHAYIIGEHGDSEVPVWSLANVAGMRLPSFCSENGIPLGSDTMDRIFRQTRDAAYEIISRKGATYYAVAAGLMRITEAILRDQNTVLSISSLVEDYYGIDGVCLSLPTVVGRRGIERVLRLDLSPREARGVRKSAEVLRQTIDSLGPITG